MRYGAAGILAAAFLFGGCEDVRYYNTRVWMDKPVPKDTEAPAGRFMRNNYYYPGRDAFDPRVWASPADPAQPRAMDIDESGEVPDSSFYMNRAVDKITREQAAAGPAAGVQPPRNPWTVSKRSSHDGSDQFVGKDAAGRKFMVKLDHPDYPEAGSGASIIVNRLFWLMGYYVPPSFIVTVDGKRGEASLFIQGEDPGPFDLDTYRYRREYRGLRILSAWLDDLDRASNNTIATREGDTVRYYFIDFNSSLGLWQGRPKEPWQGHRHFWDPTWGLVNLVTLGGLARSQIRSTRPVSKAVGMFYAEDFDPMQWTTQQPNSPYRFMTREDARWMARKIAAIRPEQLRAIVKAAKYSEAKDEEYVFQTLMARREKILALMK
jgi:hypothetical protein